MSEERPLPTLVLASASPRRAQLLAEHGLSFEISPADVEEVWDEDLAPDELAMDLAAQKALSVWTRHPERWILAADTLVVLDSAILGKPADREEAEAMLRALAGRSHEVVTGVALCGPEGAFEEFSETTRVEFCQLSEAALSDYLEDSAEWRDKAGAYGIQSRGGAFVQRYEGSWSNVVGLPMEKVLAALARIARGPEGGSDSASPLAEPRPSR